MAKKDFILVRWIDEETVGVMPVSSVHKDDKIFVGGFVNIRWSGKKYYEAEILKISDNRQQLSKLCDRLVNFEISREELLKQADGEVDSTTQTPPVLPLAKKPKKEKEKKSKPVKAKAKAKEAAIASAQERAKEIFMSIPSPSPSPSISEESDEDIEKSSASREKSILLDQIKKQQELIAKLQQRNSVFPPPVLVTKNVVSKSSFNAMQQNISYEQSPPACDNDFEHVQSSYDSTPQSSSSVNLTPTCSVKDIYSNESTPSGLNQKEFQPKRLMSTAGPSDSAKVETRRHLDKEKFKTEPNKVELVPGYGIMLTQRQLDESVDESQGSATRLIRNLISVFFTREELAMSSCYGSGSNDHNPLDKDIIAACLRFVQTKHPHVPRTLLVDAVNDKCSNCRRRRKKNL